MKDPHRQVKLVSGTVEMMCNLRDHPKLRVGNSLTLKDWMDPSRWWTIAWISRHLRDKKSLKTTWSNNI